MRNIHQSLKDILSKVPHESLSDKNKYLVSELDVFYEKEFFQKIFISNSKDFYNLRNKFLELSAEFGEERLESQILSVAKQEAVKYFNEHELKNSTEFAEKIREFQRQIGNEGHPLISFEKHNELISRKKELTEEYKALFLKRLQDIHDNGLANLLINLEKENPGSVLVAFYTNLPYLDNLDSEVEERFSDFYNLFIKL